jgi:hypothetical protein
MKITILVALFVSMFWSAVWYVGYFNFSEFSTLDQKTYIITANIKFLIMVALYIAWRVTPNSTQ